MFKCKKNITFLVINLFVIMSIVSCNLDTSNGINNISEKTNNTTTDNKNSGNGELSNSEIVEYSELENLAISHLKELGMEGSSGKVNTAYSIIKANENSIKSIAKKLNVPEQIIKAIIFREQLLLGVEDAFVDASVKNSYKEIEKNNLDPKNYQGVIDSSTGIGQVFARSAISAEIRVNGDKALDSENYQNIKEMWYKLQDDEVNIYYVALVLKEKAKILGVNINSSDNSTIEKIIERYNGSGAKAEIYGKQTIEYYDVFKKNK